MWKKVRQWAANSEEMLDVQKSNEEHILIAYFSWAENALGRA